MNKSNLCTSMEHIQILAFVLIGLNIQGITEILIGLMTINQVPRQVDLKMTKFNIVLVGISTLLVCSSVSIPTKQMLHNMVSEYFRIAKIHDVKI
jgi:hypothetical protein